MITPVGRVGKELSRGTKRRVIRHHAWLTLWSVIGSCLQGLSEWESVVGLKIGHLSVD